MAFGNNQRGTYNATHYKEVLTRNRCAVGGRWPGIGTRDARRRRGRRRRAGTRHVVGLVRDIARIVRRQRNQGKERKPRRRGGRSAPRPRAERSARQGPDGRTGSVRTGAEINDWPRLVRKG